MSGRPQHGEGQALALRGRGNRFSPKKPSRYRSAGACPPRWPSSKGGVLGPLGPKRTRAVFFVPLSVVCDRLITNGSRSGDLDLQGLARERWRGTGFPTALR